MNISDVQNTTPIQQMMEKLSTDVVFGAPKTENGTTIIPVAQVEFGFGYGGGYGSSPNGGQQPAEESEDNVEAQNEDSNEDRTSEGGGSGGGAGGRTTPRGFIRISSDDVSYQPIMDELRIPLAGILMAAWSVFWITATVRTIAKASVTKKKLAVKT